MSKYQLLPPLSDAELGALREDIQANGVRVPIDVDEAGEVLDGHHRKAVAIMLGIECPERVIHGLQDFEKVDYALTVNLARRHLDRGQRRELVIKSLKRDARLSDREHARRCGVDHKTVGSIRGDLLATGEIPQSGTRLGGDGRERPAHNESTKTSGPAATSPAGGSGENTPAGRPLPSDTTEVPSLPVRAGDEGGQLEEDHRDANPGDAAQNPTDGDPDDLGDEAGSEASPEAPSDDADGREQQAPAGVSVPAAPVSDPDKVRRNEAIGNRTKDTPAGRATARRRHLYDFIEKGYAFIGAVGPDEIVDDLDADAVKDVETFRVAWANWVVALEAEHKQRNRLRLVKGA